ncbi:hypothetical protein [Dankookia sp. P2]|uniref:hypothetical protein n=1 Tax=Dankookia sp. P2 TaxID=3423955 RepID=UPI003D677225
MSPNMERRVAALEQARNVQRPAVWHRIICPDGLTGAAFEAWQANQLRALPPGHSVIIRRLIDVAPRSN